MKKGVDGVCLCYALGPVHCRKRGREREREGSSAGSTHRLSTFGYGSDIENSCVCGYQSQVVGRGRVGMRQSVDNLLGLVQDMARNNLDVESAGEGRKPRCQVGPMTWFAGTGSGCLPLHGSLFSFAASPLRLIPGTH
jgi:hypothetical protein